MIILTSYKGSTVQAGVRWEYDKKTITVRMVPGGWDRVKRGYKYILYNKSWENYCPHCKKAGILYPHGAKGRKTATEGEITCKQCDNDFDGVTGYKKIYGSKLHLKKASSNSSTNAKTETTQQDKKEALLELKKDYKDKSKPKKDFKITIPPLKWISEGKYIELKPPLVKTTQTFFIGQIDTSPIDMTLTLYDRLPDVGTEYSNGGSTKSVTSKGANSTIEKRIMLKGKELGSITDIYKWLRKDGGKGGFRFKHYLNHRKGESIYEFGVSSAKWCWENKIANCVDFAWIFYTMCRGAGIKIHIVNGKATFPDGVFGHMWTTYKGKVKDCSSSSAKHYKKERVVI